MQGSRDKRSLEQRRWNCIPKSHLRPKNWRVHLLAAEHSPDPVMRPYKEPVSAELREQLIVGAAAGVTWKSTATSKHSGRLEEIAMTERAQRIVLASRPVGEPTLDNFRVEEISIPQPGPGQMLLHTRWLSLDPYMRGRMSDAPSYAKPVGIGEVMEGGTVSDVVTSNVSGFAKGDIVVGRTGWQNSRAIRWLRPAEGRSHARADFDCARRPRHAGHDGLCGIV